MSRAYPTPRDLEMETTDLIPVLLLIAASALDAARDKFNTVSNKRPNSWLPWPLIDRWHLIKKAGFHLPLVWIWWYDVEGVYWKAAAVVLSLIAWKLVPMPSHWKKGVG
jgi:hypothetical protein